MIAQVHVQLETDERWDDPMGGIQTSDQVHVRSGDSLETDEGDGMGSSNEVFKPSLRTLWGSGKR